jgi:hypothetical protein
VVAACPSTPVNAAGRVDRQTPHWLTESVMPHAQVSKVELHLCYEGDVLAPLAIGSVDGFLFELEVRGGGWGWVFFWGGGGGKGKGGCWRHWPSAL